MRHDWVFDVLRDLKSFAQSNGLPALAQKADEAINVAHLEIASRNGDAVNEGVVQDKGVTGGPRH